MIMPKYTRSARCLWLVRTLHAANTQRYSRSTIFSASPLIFGCFPSFSARLRHTILVKIGQLINKTNFLFSPRQSGNLTTSNRALLLDDEFENWYRLSGVMQRLQRALKMQMHSVHDENIRFGNEKRFFLFSGMNRAMFVLDLEKHSLRFDASAEFKCHFGFQIERHFGWCSRSIPPSNCAFKFLAKSIRRRSNSAGVSASLLHTVRWCSCLMSRAHNSSKSRDFGLFYVKSRTRRSGTC